MAKPVRMERMWIEVLARCRAATVGDCRIETLRTGNWS
jgi:hypothetical protein